MHRLSDEQLCEKLKEAHSLGFIQEISIIEAKKNKKVIGREIVFNTGISNIKAKENHFLIQSIKKGLKEIFRRAIKERINLCGVAELSISFGRMKQERRRAIWEVEQ